MKKYFIFAAAAVTFAACTEDVLIDNTKAPENNNEVAIGFGSDINKLVMTRADEDHAENSTGARGEGLENYHYTFRIWGYKNIKNPGTTTPATYTSTPVFDGDKNNEKTVATWSPAGNNTAPFNTKNDNLGGGDWVYSPVRYWDKTATNYDFHAAAPDKDSTLTVPAPLDWKWTQINIDETTGSPTTTAFTDKTADAKGAGYFTLGTADAPFKLNGESLPLANATVAATATSSASYYNVTTQPNDVFGGKKKYASTDNWSVKDVDLMIAEDVCNEKPALHSSSPTGTNARVNFHFNHILSRLNIGVKIGDQIAVKQMVTYGGSSTDTNKYLLYTYDGVNYIKKEEKAQPVTLADDGTISDNGDPIDWPTTGIKIDDNVKNPTEGVVLLKDIEVVNLVQDGFFDEGVLAWKDASTKAMNGNDTSNKFVTPTDLKTKGTNLRWTLGSTKTNEKTAAGNSIYGFPNEKVTGKLDEDDDAVFNLSKKFTVKVGDVETPYTKDDYKMVFQGLVIPQDAEYESIAIDGSDISTKQNPYIKIVYTLDGEVFTNYYNLAEVFSNVLAQYTIQDEEDTPNTYKAYKTSTNDYAYQKEGATDGKWYDQDFEELTLKGYKDGDKYYNTEKKALDSEPTGDGIILLCNAGEKGTNDVYQCNLIPVTRGEATEADVTDECNITFCEGWQNNLWITINPVAILFEANVYKWADKYQNEYTVE